MRQRDDQIGQSCLQQIAQFKLMCGVGVAVHQTDGDGGGAAFGEVLGQAFHSGFIKRLEFIAAGVHPPCNGESPFARYNQVGLFEVDVILAVAAFVGDFEDVAEACCRHRRHDRPAPFDQCIGGQRRAVNEALDLGPVAACVSQHPFRPCKRAECRVCGGRWRFGGSQNGVLRTDQNSVGEGATDIDGKAKPVGFEHEGMTAKEWEVWMTVDRSGLG